MTTFKLAPRYSVLLVMALLLAISGCARRYLRVQPEPLVVTGATVLWQGIYTNRPVYHVPDPTSPSGMNTLGTRVRLIAGTNAVPAVLGTRFGVVFQPEGSPTGAYIDVTNTVFFPGEGIFNPAQGKMVRSHSVRHAVPLGRMYLVGYCLDVPAELKPGVWRMELRYGKRKFAEATFTLFEPGKEPQAGDGTSSIVNTQ